MVYFPQNNVRWYIHICIRRMRNRIQYKFNLGINGLLLTKLRIDVPEELTLSRKKYGIRLWWVSKKKIFEKSFQSWGFKVGWGISKIYQSTKLIDIIAGGERWKQQKYTDLKKQANQRFGAFIRKYRIFNIATENLSNTVETTVNYNSLYGITEYKMKWLEIRRDTLKQQRITTRTTIARLVLPSKDLEFLGQHPALSRRRIIEDHFVTKLWKK